MYGALLGDMIGAPYEFDRGNKTKDFEMFCRDAVFTDDSVMTVAVAEALMDAEGQPEEAVKSALVKSMQKWGKRYPGCRLWRQVLSVAEESESPALRKLRKRFGHARLGGRLAVWDPGGNQAVCTMDCGSDS